MIRRIAAAALLACTTAFAQTSPATGTAANPPKPLAFEVASIRLHKVTGDGSRWMAPTADGYETRNEEPAQLILEAYGIKCSDQLAGLPAWASEDTFDIEAKIDEDILPAYQGLSDRERKEQAALMLRSMLTDRFNLKVHHESRLLPVYALVVAKGGAKLKQSQAPENLYGMVEGRGFLSVRAGPIGARLIVGLSDITGRIVIDKTGLTGDYDIELNWSSDEDLAAGASGRRSLPRSKNSLA